jgi:hypothetical protein
MTTTLCPACSDPITVHIGHKPCVQGKTSTATSIYDLPIAEWAWKGDASVTER